MSFAIIATLPYHLRSIWPSAAIDPKLIPNGGCLFQFKHSRMVWINITVVIAIEFSEYLFLHDEPAYMLTPIVFLSRPNDALNQGLLLLCASRFLKSLLLLTVDDRSIHRIKSHANDLSGWYVLDLLKWIFFSCYWQLQEPYFPPAFSVRYHNW